jgi:hypothetical protein
MDRNINAKNKICRQAPYMVMNTKILIFLLDLGDIDREEIYLYPFQVVTYYR